MQQRELALKEQQAAAKAQTDMAKVQVDAQKAEAKTMLDLEKMDQEERLESAKTRRKGGDARFQRGNPTRDRGLQGWIQPNQGHPR